MTTPSDVLDALQAAHKTVNLLNRVKVLASVPAPIAQWLKANDYLTAVKDMYARLEGTATSYEEYCELGRIAREAGDWSRWELGDIAGKVRTKWADDTLGSWAKEVGISLKTAQEYRIHAAFYPLPARADIQDMPNVFYSHTRLARRLGTLDAAVEFLEECSLNDYSVDYAAVVLAKRLKGEPPGPVLKKLATVPGVKIAGGTWLRNEGEIRLKVTNRETYDELLMLAGDPLQLTIHAAQKRQNGQGSPDLEPGAMVAHKTLNDALLALAEGTELAS